MRKRILAMVAVVFMGLCWGSEPAGAYLINEDLWMDYPATEFRISSNQNKRFIEITNNKYEDPVRLWEVVIKARTDTVIGEQININNAPEGAYLAAGESYRFEILSDYMSPETVLDVLYHFYVYYERGGDVTYSTYTIKLDECVGQVENKTEMKCVLESGEGYGVRWNGYEVGEEIGLGVLDTHDMVLAEVGALDAGVVLSPKTGGVVMGEVEVGSGAGRVFWAVLGAISGALVALGVYFIVRVFFVRRKA